MGRRFESGSAHQHSLASYCPARGNLLSVRTQTCKVCVLTRLQSPLTINGRSHPNRNTATGWVGLHGRMRTRADRHMPDTDTIPGLAGNVRAAEDRIRDRFKATDVDLDTDADGVTARLQFRGFSDLDAALTRVGEVARELNELEETTEVHAGINTGGGYDPHADETDPRPMGWVNATLEVEACTCGEDEACDECGGRR